VTLLTEWGSDVWRAACSQCPAKLSRCKCSETVAQQLAICCMAGSGCTMADPDREQVSV